MKNKYLVLIVLLPLLALLAGCRASEASADELEGTNWELVFIRKSTPIEGRTVTAEFKEGQIGGNLGCNSYFGSYEIAETKMTIDQIGHTEMWCQEPEGIMEQETLLAGYLTDVESWRLEEDRLYLRTSAGEELTFDRAAE